MSILRLVGVEDGSFWAFKSDQSTILCAVCMVGDCIEWVKVGNVTVDGRDVTDVLLRLIRGLRFDALILGGVSFAGFNVVDPHKVYDELGIPVIVFSGERPDSNSTLAALKAHFSDWEERWGPIERLGEVYCTVTKIGSPPVFFEIVGCTKDWAEEVLRASISLSRTPESVRVAGILARGLTRSV